MNQHSNRPRERTIFFNVAQRAGEKQDAYVEDDNHVRWKVSQLERNKPYDIIKILGYEWIIEMDLPEHQPAMERECARALIDVTDSEGKTVEVILASEYSPMIKTCPAGYKLTITVGQTITHYEMTKDVYAINIADEETHNNAIKRMAFDYKHIYGRLLQ